MKLTEFEQTLAALIEAENLTAAENLLAKHTRASLPE